jgi:uncharacterized membrane protein HdeD (DUF308 family)
MFWKFWESKHREKIWLMIIISGILIGILGIYTLSSRIEQYTYYHGLLYTLLILLIWLFAWVSRTYWLSKFIRSRKNLPSQSIIHASATRTPGIDK